MFEDLPGTQSYIMKDNAFAFGLNGIGYRTLVSGYGGDYMYALSQKSLEIARVSTWDNFMPIQTFIPFCLDTNSTDLAGYKWFRGEDVRVEGSGTLYAVMYNVLTVQNGMAGLRIN